MAAHDSPSLASFYFSGGLESPRAVVLNVGLVCGDKQFGTALSWTSGGGGRERLAFPPAIVG